MAKPVVVLVGADKGGVGKTTVSRTLLDYLTARKIPTRAFDTEWPKGTLKRFSTKADSGRTLFRYFCADCGSPIYSHRETTPETLGVRAGTLDDSSGLKITTHIWTKMARPWSHIDPAAKQVEGQP